MRDAGRANLLVDLVPDLRRSFCMSDLAAKTDGRALSGLLLEGPKVGGRATIVRVVRFLRSRNSHVSFDVLLPFLITRCSPGRLRRGVHRHFFNVRLFVHGYGGLRRFVAYVGTSRAFGVKRRRLGEKMLT